MRVFDYFCDMCGNPKTNIEMESFVCECGGSMRLNGQVNGMVFQPFYSRELKSNIRTSRQEEKLLRQKGLSYASDHNSITSEVKQIKKHKNDYIKAQHIAEGKHGWKPGLNWREKGGGWEKVAVFALLLLASPAYAQIEGVDYATVDVKGERLWFPVGNLEREQDVYYLKKLLNGDVEAREVFLGGYEERWFFIGDEKPKWLKITQDSEEVITP